MGDGHLTANPVTPRPVYIHQRNRETCSSMPPGNIALPLATVRSFYWEKGGVTEKFQYIFLD